MSFGPIHADFALGPLIVRQHFIFESLAYLVGFRIYSRSRREAGDFLDSGNRTWVVVAAIAGAAIGSKVLNWFENPAALAQHWNELLYWASGKTIVGGLLGGTLAVEWVKRRLGITRRTGDLFAIPMAIGIAIGRIGCLFAGIADDTYGTPTSLPWGFDFGDGIPRHPLPLYETCAMLVLVLWLTWLRRRPHREGDLYRAFLLSYLFWRLMIDFLKPEPRFAGLTILQWTCLIALVGYWRDLRFFLFARREEARYR